MPKIRRAPQYLKEISSGTVYNEAGGSQGDYADEWDYAESPSGGAREDWNRAHNNPNANYLGWWKRNGRGVFYFGDNERTYSTRNAWAIYDWYYAEANKLNHAIDVVNGLPNINVNSATANSKRMDLFVYPDVKINSPHNTMHAVGIKRWLDNKASEVNKAFYNYNAQVRSYNDKIFAEKMRIQSEQRKEEEKRRLEKEEKETKRFYELKGTIDDTDRRLTANINQLREDFFGAIKRQGDLFSDLSSVREKDNIDTIAQFNEALMESSKVNISLQSDVNKLNKETDNQKKDLKALRKDFRNLKNLYNVSESKLKINESELSKMLVDKAKTNKNVKDLTVQIGDQKKQSDEKFAKLNQTMQEGQERFEGTIGELREELQKNLGTVREKQDKTEKSLTGIQEKLNENSVMFANEKEKLLGEIEAIKGETGNIQPRLNVLSSKLTALTKKHDAVKTELLGKLKEQQKLNQTQFEKLNAENEARGKQYEKDVSQLRRDLDVTRALADRIEDEAIQAQNAFQKQEQRHEKQEKHNKARFKVLFDYQTNVNRQIKIQEKKTTNFAQLKRIRVMPDKAKALRNFRRGRYALLEEFV